jgi:hypothetical protein
MDWLSRQLYIKEMSDWYKISAKDFADNGASGLLGNKYNGSPLLLLSTLYPEYEWLPWKFSKCPNNFFDDLKNQRKFMDWAAQTMKIKEMSDWYKVTAKV